MTKSYRNLVIGGANPSGVARRHKARCNRRHERYQVSRAHLERLGCNRSRLTDQPHATESAPSSAVHRRGGPTPIGKLSL
jgi:hypothetical protein